VIQEQCGTPAYLAPEIIADKGYKGFYVDLWSLGVLLYTMLQGTVPFKASSLEDLHALILRGNIRYPVPISDEAKDLITRLLQVEPTERISIPQLFRHPWVLKNRCNDLYGFLMDEDEEDEHDFMVGFSFRRD